MKDLYLGALPDLALTRVRGADARALLQGQLCGDVQTVDAEHSLFTALNSPRGRMLATLHVLPADEGLWLEVNADMMTATVQRLRMFVLRSDVQFEPRESAECLRGLMGEAAPDWLAQRNWPVPAAAFMVTRGDGVTIARRPGRVPRFTLVGDAETLDSLPAIAADQLTDAWHAADIEAGVPTVYPATRDQFIPQMAGLDRFGGISFTKGCYTGQEVIARLHYLGQAKRSLYRARSTEPAAPGDRILRTEGDTAVGEVVDARHDGDAWQVLAVIQDAAAGDSLHLNKASLFDLQPVSGQSAALD